MRRFMSLLTLVQGYNIRWNDILFTTSIQIKQGQLIVQNKKKVHSHKDIYSINIILLCPLLLINTQEAQKVLWVVLSSLFFKEI